jgi:hypothetical protein
VFVLFDAALLLLLCFIPYELLVTSSMLVCTTNRDERERDKLREKERERERERERLRD